MTSQWSVGGKMAAKQQRNCQEMPSALQEKWNLDALRRRGKWGCCVTLSCGLIGSVAPICLWLVAPAADSVQLLDVGNCVEFIKPHWSPMIAFILPWPFYLVCLYLVLQRLFPITSDD